MSGQFFAFYEFVLDLGQKGGLLQDDQQLVFIDWLDQIAFRTLGDDVHEMFAVHCDSNL
jgi:hypothetical protein